MRADSGGPNGPDRLHESEAQKRNSKRRADHGRGPPPLKRERGPGANRTADFENTDEDGRFYSAAPYLARGLWR
jgi:hypothetical protein